MTRREQACGAQGQVVLGCHAGHLAQALHHAGRSAEESQFVAEVHELKRRLEQVVTVRATPDDVQEQV
jgi:AmiR/NasT family two-component response regulator